MPRELGLHTFISPFCVFSAFHHQTHTKNRFTWGEENVIKEEEKKQTEISHLLRAQSHAHREYFFIISSSTHETQ